MSGLVCPQCQGSFDSAMVMDGSMLTVRPSPGEITVCLQCAGILKISETRPLRVRLATAADLASLDEETLDNLALARLVIQNRRYQHTF